MTNPLIVARSESHLMESDCTSVWPPVVAFSRLINTRFRNGFPAPLPKKMITPATISVSLIPSTHAVRRSHLHFRRRVSCVISRLRLGILRCAAALCFHRPWKMRSLRFLPYNPLINQSVQNLHFAFGLPIHQKLVTCKLLDVALQNDFFLHSRSDAIHHLLC